MMRSVATRTLRSSVPDCRSMGIAVLWVSPMGPLKISIAQPIRSEEGDRKQPFQFTFGGAF